MTDNGKGWDSHHRSGVLEYFHHRLDHDEETAPQHAGIVSCVGWDRSRATPVGRTLWMSKFF